MTDAGTPQKPHLSFTQLNMYMRCSLQYYFRYVLGWIAPPSLPLAVGKAGHNTIEWNARHKINTGADQPTEAILDTASDSYDAETGMLSPSDIKPDEDVGKTKDAHLQLIRFYALDPKNGAPAEDPVAVEVPFEIQVPQTSDDDFPLPAITGRIDLITKVAIEDRKFVRRARTQAEVDLTPQLTLYDLAARDAGITTPNLGYRVYIPPTTREGPRIIPMRRSPELNTPTARSARIERLIYAMRTTARAIKAGIFIPTDDPKVCGSCGYRQRCQFSLVKSDFEALKARQETASV